MREITLRGFTFLLILFVTSAFAGTDIPTCLPTCSTNQICIRKEANKPAVCEAVPATAPLIDLNLPFDPSEEVYCTHSSGSGSHSWSNAFYALDLANAYDKPAAIIHAAADGKAFVFTGEDGKLCPEPKGNASKADPSACGLSWGNHIKILHSGGYYSFYAHLDHPLVANGEMVKRGQAIGVEGWTGAAGHRHLHWSVQKLPGSNPSDWEKRIAWDGESVPFRFKAFVNGVVTTVDTSTFQCAHAGIGQASAGQQPILKALK
jgi:hypothetical protein